MKITKVHQIESQFHNKWSETISLGEINFIQAFEAVTATENRFVYSLMQPVKGKRILDLGCGMGDATAYFAYQGARVEAVDLSPGMIKLVKRLANKHNLTCRIKAKTMAAEKLSYQDNSFDIIFGNGLLHHVNVNLALKEVYRTLKPGGKAYFIEPLADNFFINVYRKMASSVRTKTETPLHYSQLNQLTTAKFKSFFHREFHLLTLLIFFRFYLFEGCHPNKERYWKKIITDVDRIEGAFKMLFLLDNLILRLLPFLRRYCWNTVLVFEK